MKREKKRKKKNVSKKERTENGSNLCGQRERVLTKEHVDGRRNDKEKEKGTRRRNYTIN